MTTAGVLFATTASTDGGAAAALPVNGSTLLGRLLDQLESLDVRRIWVVTRPEWKSMVEEAAAQTTAQVTVVAGDDVSDDLRTTAEIAERTRGRLILGTAHVLTHRQALAGLLADPRIISGVLATGSQSRRHWSFPIRSVRGRVVSAGSPYHRVHRSNGYFLEFIKVDPRDRDHLIAVSRQLAELAAEPRPDRWAEEFDRKVGEWRLSLWRVAVERETGIVPDPASAPDPASFRLDPESETELALRARVSEEGAATVLLVGLVRAGVSLSPSNLRGFFYAAPVSARAVDQAVEEMSGYDEDRVALDSAVKAKDGFFTTFFVSPYSKYLARFAARRGWTPNAMTTLSFGIGVLAAASFAVGNRLGLIAGAVLLQVAFTVDCVDGQLARYTRTFSKLGAWLDSVFDRMKEYLVYGGLAVGAARSFDDDVWVLAAAALTLQTVRHMVDFSFVARQQQAIASTRRLPLEQPEDVPLSIDFPSPGLAPVVSPLSIQPTPGGTAIVTHPRAPVVAPPAEPVPPTFPQERRRLAVSTLGRRAVKLAGALERRSWGRWGKRILQLPIGERFALISLTAAIATPRVTFIALLAWGGLAAAYTVTGRILAAVAK